MISDFKNYNISKIPMMFQYLKKDTILKVNKSEKIKLVPMVCIFNI